MSGSERARDTRLSTVRPTNFAPQKRPMAIHHARIVFSAFALAQIACVSRTGRTEYPPDAHVAWTETPPGGVLVRWLSSYNTGISDTIRAFAEREFAPSDLTKRSAEERAASDRWMHVNLGRMRVVHVDSLTDTTITATVWQDLIEGWGHVSVRVALAAPHKLISRHINFFRASARRPVKERATPEGAVRSGVVGASRRICSPPRRR